MSGATAPRGRVPGSWLLAAAMVAAWLAAIAAGVDPWAPAPADAITLGAGHGPRTLADQPWRLLSSAFVHLGGLLLAINVGALVALGPALERRCGRAGGAAILLGATVVASAASVTAAPYAITAGASGMIAGLCGALALLLAWPGATPRSRRVLAAVGALIAWGALLPLWADGVDHVAHGAGLVAGAGLAALARGRSRRGLRAAAALAAAGVTAAALLALAPRPYDLRATGHRLVALEARFDRIVDGAGTRPDGPRLARTLEAEVIAPLRALAATLPDDARMPPRDRARARALARYLAARLRALALFVRYLDTGDAALAAEITAAAAEAAAAQAAVGR